ncbi:hypothetical protein [Sphingobium sp. 15-1]|uniref:hypothetical protein n=1 Tax=Sphingobium sp. 15-1 TaxID=2729616 RepID=UPI001C3F642B|nr:hypothetical protein [Sphingobium sp. 15-1]
MAGEAAKLSTAKPRTTVRAEPVEAFFFFEEEKPLAAAALRVDKLRANGFVGLGIIRLTTAG